MNNKNCITMDSDNSYFIFTFMSDSSTAFYMFIYIFNMKKEFVFFGFLSSRNLF